MLLEDVEADATQDSEVLSAVARTETGIILTKGYIQRPVEGVFNAPVGAHGLKNEFGIGRQGRNEIGRFGLSALSRGTLALQHDNRSQASPTVVMANDLKSALVRQRPAT